MMSKDTYKHIFRHFVLIEKRVRDSKIKHEVIMRVGFVQQMYVTQVPLNCSTVD